MRHKPMTVAAIYQKYNIPPNLQKHQLRVAYVGHTIAKNWHNQDIKPEDVLEAGLFHDMGNLIKFNFDKPEMLEGEDVGYWKKAQQQFINRYGNHVHQATLAICQEIGLSPTVTKTIEIAEWDDAPILIQTGQIAAYLLIYADMRVGPFGILSYRDRIDNLQQRSPSNNYRKRLEYAQKIETLLQSHTDIILTEISETGFQEFADTTFRYQLHPELT